ncbi:uncharacterized protein [Centroberyx affinis]|uniref:uncharacterized protein isoform X3 n=1 Tax=Centroberyx affinis TaxID=166261 RepID=UPI003A5BBE25
MSLLDQMELRPLIELSLILILASDTNGQKYMINVRDVNTPLHSDVTIPCNFTYKKPAENVHKLQVYWKISQRSKITTGDNDINAFIFHPNDTYVTEEYRGRTHLVGDINNQDCSLMIQNISHNVDRIYMRIATGNDFYNYKKSVRITVSGPGGTSAPFTDEVSTTDPSELTKMPRTSIYIATSVPIAAVLIVIFVLCGVFYYRKRKRLLPGRNLDIMQILAEHHQPKPREKNLPKIKTASKFLNRRSLMNLFISMFSPPLIRGAAWIKQTTYMQM